MDSRRAAGLSSLLLALLTGCPSPLEQGRSAPPDGNATRGEEVVAPDRKPAPLPQEEVAELLARIDARVYTPATAGLEDLRVVLRLTEKPDPTQPWIVLYWKAPDRRRVRFETPEGQPTTGFDHQLTEGRSALEWVVPVPFARRKAELQEDGSLILQPTAGDVVGEVRRWRFDTTYLPTGSETARPMTFSHTDRYVFADQGGKLLLSTIERHSTTDMGNSQVTIRFEYAQHKGYWLPTRELLTHFFFEHYRVNEGVDDAVFEDGGY